MPPTLALIRPRTLSLSIAVVCTANALAWHDHTVQFSTFFLSLLTVLLLQIVSNIANDYGDGIRGTDAHRSPNVPTRLTATSSLKPHTVQRYLWTSVFASIISGLLLLASSLHTWHDGVIFLLLGIIAIVAALAYTLGRYAYGYYALGEVAVFLMFGLLGIHGNYYLQTHTFTTSVWLPAIGSGLLAAAVLHINNIRDRDSDLRAGKYTLANQISFSGCFFLHVILVLFGFLAYFAYVVQIGDGWLCVFILPMMWRHLKRLSRKQISQQVGAELASVVKLHFGLNILFSIGLMI